MLVHIHIHNLTTIETLELNVHGGCTMITGETGAGKSVFIEAIELGLGGRASPHVVRKGKEKAEISLCFDLKNFPAIVKHLKQLDLYQDSNDCIIRRVITQDGRSRCYINGSLVTVQLVKELGELLFHLHSQHEQHVLLNAHTQREMLDRYAEHLPLVQEVETLAKNFRTLLAKIKLLQDKTTERNNRSTYLKFQLDELAEINLTPLEWKALEREHQKLTHKEDLIQHIESAILQISNEDQEALLPALKKTRKILDEIKSIEPEVSAWINVIDSSFIQLDELTSTLKHYLDDLEHDPKQLQLIEQRISQIFNLSRKHKIAPENLLTFKEELETELKNLNASDQSILALEEEKNNILEAYEGVAKKLSESRKTHANRFQKEITTIMRSLSLPYGEFCISLEKYTVTADNPISIYGNEKIIFLIKTNPDQPLQPLSKSISGGELSRLSLATHLALANHAPIPTLIFDEIDTGLSGATAEKIGKLLRQLGNAYQLFCVTHQPQVAALGHHHLYVEKYFAKDCSYTRLQLLNEEEKTKEIARLLGGETITEKTLAHAEEVLQRC